jgi:fructose-1,6-bisphosphatase/inositol monophosphatase family enzyme
MTYKKFALDLAKQAGKVMLANFVLGMNKTIKKDGTPVTKADLAINKMVVDSVKKYFPTHGVLGEEQSNIISGSKYTWVCDPVDGTIPFSHGMPTCMFSLALTLNGKPILGVAYDPFLDRMFFAELGKGAFLKGKRIKVSGHEKLKGAFVSDGLWKMEKYYMPNLVHDFIFKKDVNIFPMGSVVYNGMLLAAGQLDGILFNSNTAHDVAAVKIIVEEAGGKVTDFFGKEQRYDRENIKGCVITNGLLHKDLLKVIRRHINS